VFSTRRISFTNQELSMKTWLPTLALTLAASSVFADPLTCNLTGYKACPV
jgi:hypothetical protein